MPHLYGGKVAGMVQRQEILMLQIDFSQTPWPVYEDRYGIALVEPDERIAVIEHTPRITAGGMAAMAAGKLSFAEQGSKVRFHPGEDPRPIAAGCLPIKPQARVPGAVVAIQHPAPVRNAPKR